MAKFKVGQITEYLNERIKHLEGEIQLAVHKDAGEKLAKTAAITLEMQMRAKGVKRAKSTGSHDRRSVLEKIKADKHGSMLDVYYKVWRSKDRSKSMIFAGQTSAAYKARFVNDGFSNWHWWGNNTGSNVRGKHFIEASHKIVNAEIPKVVSKSISNAISKSKKKKRNYTI